MGLLGALFGSQKPETKAEKKARIKREWDFKIETRQRVLDTYKKKKADAQWQLKMTKDSSHKRTIAECDRRIKEEQQLIKQFKACKAAALANVK